MSTIDQQKYSALEVHVLGDPGSYGDQVRKILLPNSMPRFIETNASIIDVVVHGN